MRVRIFSDNISSSIFINEKLVAHDIFVKSAWLLVKLEFYDVIPNTDSITKLVTKYGSFGNVPSIHDFVNNDFTEFFTGVDIQSIKIDINKKHPKLFSTLQKYLLQKHKITF